MQQHSLTGHLDATWQAKCWSANFRLVHRGSAPSASIQKNGKIKTCEAKLFAHELSRRCIDSFDFFLNISNKAITAKAYKDCIVRPSPGAAQSISRSYATVGIELIKKKAVSLGHGVQMALVITSSLSTKEGTSTESKRGAVLSISNVKVICLCSTLAVYRSYQQRKGDF